MSKESVGKDGSSGAVAVAVIMIVAAIGVPAGWYGPRVTSAVVSQPVPINVAVEAPVVTEALTPVEADQLVADPATAAKRQPEKDKIKAREEKGAITNAIAPRQPAPTIAAVDTAKAGPKRITVTVTRDESGRYASVRR